MNKVIKVKYIIIKYIKQSTKWLNMQTTVNYELDHDLIIKPFS